MKEHCKENRLNKYLDDELNKSKQSTVKQHLSHCSSCQKTLALLKLQRELLRDELTSAVEQADFTGFENRVMQKIQQEKPSSLSERIRVRTRELVFQYRAVWITSLVTAAIILVVLFPYLSKDPAGSLEIMPPTTSEDMKSQLADQVPIDNQLIIDSIEYAGQRSMIFTVSKNNTTVIWLYDFDQAAEHEAEGDDI